MMFDREKRGRRDYLNDFQKTANGEYIYTGRMMDWPEAGEGSRRQALLRLWGCMLPGAVASVAVGCIRDTDMDGRAYVLLPYAIGLILCVWSVWCLGRLTVGKPPLRAYAYHETVERLPKLALGWAVCAGVTLVGELVALFLPDFSGRAGMAWLLIALEGIALLSSLAVRRIMRRTKGDI